MMSSKRVRHVCWYELNISVALCCFLLTLDDGRQVEFVSDGKYQHCNSSLIVSLPRSVYDLDLDEISDVCVEMAPNIISFSSKIKH